MEDVAQKKPLTHGKVSQSPQKTTADPKSEPESLPKDSKADGLPSPLDNLGISTLVKVSPFGVVLVGSDGRCHYLNPKFSEIFGFTLEQIPTSREWFRLAYPDPELRQQVIEAWRRQVKDHPTGATADTTFPVRCADGGIKTILFRVANLEDGFHLVVCEDVTARQAAEKEHRQTREQWRIAVDYAPVGVAILDEQRRFVQVNPKLCETLGYTAEELLGSSSDRLTHPEDIAATQKRWRQLINGEADYQRALKRYLHKNGRTIWMLVNNAILRDETQKPVCFIIYFLDVTAQKEAEDALKESEKKYRRLVESSQDWVWSIDIKGRLTYSNNALKTMLGYSPGELIGSPVLPYIHPSQWEAARRMFLMCVRSQRGWRPSQLQWVHKDGSPRYFESTSEPTIDESGHLIGFTGSDRDITERKKAEDALKESESRFHSLVDQAGEAIFVHDLGGRFVDVNQMACRFLGYSREELLNMWVGDLDPDLVQRNDPKTYWANLSEQGPVTFESRQQRKDGSLFPVEITLGSIEYSGQKMILALIRDISERKEAEAALTMSAEIARVLPWGLVIYQYEPPDRLVLVEANPASEIIDGKALPEKVGLEFDDIWPELEGREVIKDALLEVVRQKKFYEEERLNLREPGLDAYFRMRSFPMPNQRVGVAFEDIAPKMRIEREKAKLEERLRQAHKMEAIGTLAGGIAHDFNNILAAISGYTEVAQKKAQDGETCAHELEGILNSALRAKSLIKQILTFSRRSQPQLKPLPLNQPIQNAVDFLKHILPKMVSIETELAPDLWPVMGDMTELEQVIMNLGSNAADAMPQGGRLVITTRNFTQPKDGEAQYTGFKPGEYAMVVVSDNGLGMDEKIQRQMFDPFFTTKEVGKGTGLGMSTVYGVIESHQGIILCDSRPGEGAIFRMFFPRAADAGLRLKPPPPVSPDQKAGRGEKILVVDDEPAIREVVSFHLNSLGYSSLTATTGEEALSIFKADPSDIDALVLDLGMPGMGGERCLQEILDIDQTARVLVVSGYPLKERLTQKAAKNLVRFLSKPFRLPNLTRTLREVLDAPVPAD